MLDLYPRDYRLAGWTFAVAAAVTVLVGGVIVCR
ncbi:hypothetical protein ABH931_003049 [Streptacidiphilus sp. MAP12-33]